MERKKGVRPGVSDTKRFSNGGIAELWAYDLVDGVGGKFYHQVAYKPPKGKRVLLVRNYTKYDAVEIETIFGAMKSPADFFRARKELASRDAGAELPTSRVSLMDIDEEEIEPPESELEEIAENGLDF